MHRLWWALVREMARLSQLVARRNLIEETLRLEGNLFRKTLERGLRNPRREEHCAQKGDMFDCDTAFTCTTPTGFPRKEEKKRKKKILPKTPLRNRAILDGRSFTARWSGKPGQSRAALGKRPYRQLERPCFPLREKTRPTEFLGYENREPDGVVGAW